MKEVNHWFEVVSGTPLKVWLGAYWHEGLADGMYVIHNSKAHGKVVRSTYAEFSAGNKIFVCEELQVVDMAVAIQRARSALGVAYDLWVRNCQHFVRWAHGLEQESPQIQQALMAASGLAIATISKHPVTQSMGAGMSIATMLTPEGKSPIAFGIAGALFGAFAGALASGS